MWKFLVKVLLQLQKASVYSISGLRFAFQDEFAFRLELLCALIAVPIAFFLGHSALERAILISSLFLVFIAELLNSAIETTLNRIDLKWDPLTKKAKDMGSAAVFITLINALVVWVIITFNLGSS